MAVFVLMYVSKDHTLLEKFRAIAGVFAVSAIAVSVHDGGLRAVRPCVLCVLTPVSPPHPWWPQRADPCRAFTARLCQDVARAEALCVCAGCGFGAMQGAVAPPPPPPGLSLVRWGGERRKVETADRHPCLRHPV
jgi:hypothetical protein